MAPKAISSGSPRSRMGIFERCHASASAVTLAWIGVCIAPGTIVFTRILLLTHSIATALVIVRIELVLALWAIIPGHPRRPSSELLFTIAPPPLAAITGSAARIPRHVPVWRSEERRVGKEWVDT